MISNTKKLIKDLVSNINQGLPFFEKDWVSVQRYPDSELVKPQSLKEFIEIRFNFEASRIPELSDAVLKSEGRLFSCVDLEDADEIKRKYKKAVIKLISADDIPDEFNDLKSEINTLRDFLGGDTISFNCMKRKIKLNIYE